MVSLSATAVLSLSLSLSRSACLSTDELFALQDAPLVAHAHTGVAHEALAVVQTREQLVQHRVLVRVDELVWDRRELGEALERVVAVQRTWATVPCTHTTP